MAGLGHMPQRRLCHFVVGGGGGNPEGPSHAAHLGTDVAHNHPSGLVQGIRLVGGHRALMHQLDMGEAVLQSLGDEALARPSGVGHLRPIEHSTTTAARLGRVEGGQGTVDHRLRSLARFTDNHPGAG